MKHFEPYWTPLCVKGTRTSYGLTFILEIPEPAGHYPLNFFFFKNHGLSFRLVGE